MPPRPAPAHFAALLLAASLCAAPLAAEEAEEGWQPADTFVETVSVEVVNLEVWVTDRQGRPVTGLPRDAFELYEEGKRVEITHFTAFEPLGAGPAHPTALAAPPARPEPEAPAGGLKGPVSEDSRLHLAIFVDNWNLRPADRERVFQDLREFLRTRIQPEDRVMIAVHDRSLELVQDFTSDPEALEAALDRVGRLASGAVSLANERRSTLASIREIYENAPTILGDETSAHPCFVSAGEMENAARNYAVSVQAHAQRSGGALASVSEILSGVPGRKVLLYLGSGLAQQAGIELFQFLSELCPNTTSALGSHQAVYDLTWLYEEVVRRANAHGVTFYMLDATAPEAGEDLSVGGLMGSSQPTPLEEDPRASLGAMGITSPIESGIRSMSTGAAAFRPSAGTRQVAEIDLQGPLVVIARETGGRAILNAAQFREDFDLLAADLRTYYSLGFAPDHQGDGRLHRLEVKVEGDGYRVRHRRSYLDKPFEQRMAERIRGAAQLWTVENPLGVLAETGEPTPSAGRGQRVPVRIWVPLEALTLLPADGGLEGRLRVVMAVTDAAGNLGPVRQKVVPVAVGAGSGEVRPPDQLIEVNLDLDGDFHVVALAVRDEIGGETSYLRHEVRLGAEAQVRLDR